MTPTLTSLLTRVREATGPDRFWSKVKKLDEENGCWIWTASTSKKGYGQFSIGSRSKGTYRNLKAHRVAFILAGNHLHDYSPLDHLCRNRRCVNPLHLEAVSTAENNKRAGDARITCSRGHPLVPDNITRGRGGTRECRECRLNRKRMYRRRAALEQNESADG